MRRIKNDLIWLAVRALLALAGLLPLRAALAAGRALGWLGCFVARGDRRRALANLALAFPDLPPRERARLCRRAFANLGETAAEIALLRRVLRAGRVDLPDASRAALDAALADGRGAIFVSAHLGNWELLAADLARRGVPATVVTRRAYDSRIEAHLQSLRRAAGVRAIDRAAGHRRAFLQALGRGDAVGLLLDQRTGLPSSPVPFFGRTAPMPSAPAAYAARRGIPVVAGFARRVGRLHHVVDIAPVEPTPAAMAAAIEAAVRGAPDQWVWVHDRWNASIVPDADARFPTAVSGAILRPEAWRR